VLARLPAGMPPWRRPRHGLVSHGTDGMIRYARRVRQSVLQSSVYARAFFTRCLPPECSCRRAASHGAEAGGVPLPPARAKAVTGRAQRPVTRHVTPLAGLVRRPQYSVAK